MNRCNRCWIALLGFAVPAVAGDFPVPPDTESSPTLALPAAEAAAGFRTPEGFRVEVFAAEPDVRNPVAMAWDARGRLWVAENYTYSDLTQKFDLRLRDRVLIFDDTDTNGRFDRRTVFTDDVQRLASVELGPGGAWMLCPPQLLFVPDRDQDDVPDGPAEVRLDGFTVAAENYHTFANGLRWGPDGWLYGRCGASSPAQVGAPGTPEDRRVPVRGGLWRYHPRTRRFEALCHGTTNPWGHDWDARGEAFFINTTNGHLWHAIPGAHFVRPHTIEPNPRAYAQIDLHADHLHWDDSREMKYPYIPSNEDDRRGGGHAHSGVMIYLADQWPEPYRGKLFTLNFHGRRVNVERLERAGSGFIGRHEPDILHAADPWFRGIDLGYGPDGGVFVLDWSDTGECHELNGVHRNSGRIYKITHGTPRPAACGDLGRLDQRGLVDLHRHASEWYVRQARRLLAERSARGERLDEARAALRAIYESDPDLTHQLRALFTLYTIGDLDGDFLRALLRHEHESMRAWGIRLLTDHMPIDTVYSRRIETDVEPPADLLAEFASLAREDPSGLVRLVLASTLQRLPVKHRAPLAGALLSRAEDAEDHNIPALIWTALIPVAEIDPDALVALAAGSRHPDVRRYIARRLGEDVEARPAPLEALLEVAASRPGPLQSQTIHGLVEALAGWHKARQPATWGAFRATIDADDADLSDRVRDLDVLFGDGRALDEVRRLALDESAPLDARKAALRTLIQGRPPDLRATCEKLLRVRFLNAVAVRGLALYDDPEIGRSLAASYRTFHPTERAAALDALASRPVFARALLDQVAAGKIPRQDINAFHARQIRGLGDPGLARRLAEVWGEQRDSPADRRERIASLKGQLEPAALASADRSRGRALFDRACASCHKLYGHGGEIGPDLTGSGRDSLDYLLENLLDPSASVSADFKMSVVALRDGRVLNGLVRGQTDRTLTLQTPTEVQYLDRDDIDELQSSPLSLMPEGLLDPLSREEIRDLIAYLMNRAQVPLSGEGR
jgi:putative membrane-bound dehydrogenase-like protein